MQEKYLRDDNRGMVYDVEMVDQADFCLGDYRWWQRQNKVLGNAGGRGTVYFVASGSGECALRHYRRGGLIGRWFDDHFVWAGEHRIRSFREWRLLVKLREQGLPVPQPVAAVYQRHGLLYTAELLTLRIAGAEPLSKRLADGTVAASHWRSIGRCIRRFHEFGSYHADLTGHNIMLDDSGNMHLLDFDRGSVRADGGWKQGNLNRLNRSLRKISAHDENVSVSENDWRILIEAYNGAT